MTQEQIEALRKLGINVVVMDKNDPKVIHKIHDAVAEAIDEERVDDL